MAPQDLQTLLALFLRDLYAGTVGLTSGVGLSLTDGTTAANSGGLQFASEPTLRVYRNSAAVLGVAGSLTVSGSITAGNNINCLTTAAFTWGAARNRLMAPADGQMNMVILATTSGVGFDFATDALLKVRTRAQTGDAAITASLYGSSTVSALTITTNTIAPTSLIHQLGAGLVKTITVPATMGATGFLIVHPTAAFTYDATGNILVPSGGGTAVIDKVMILAWNGTKWVPSY